jgi:hypothetical protein
MSISEHFQYPNDVFQSDIFVSDIGITDVDVGCRILPTFRSMSMPTYGYYPQATGPYSLFTDLAHFQHSTVQYPLSIVHLPLHDTTPHGTHQPKHGISSSLSNLYTKKTLHGYICRKLEYCSVVFHIGKMHVRKYITIYLNLHLSG